MSSDGISLEEHYDRMKALKNALNDQERIISKRKKGLNGIAVDSDHEAIQWQTLQVVICELMNDQGYLPIAKQRLQESLKKSEEKLNET